MSFRARRGALALFLCVASCRQAAWPAARPDWAYDAVGYEIFVRSFQDSNGDGIGDLRGLTSRLDYLADLGVDVLWLMPINEGPSWHGYAVANYRTIEPDYGTLGDWDALVRAASARGIRIILDYVMNHTSSAHPWFKEAARDPSSPKHGWYVWRDHDPGWTRPWDGGRTWYESGGELYYALFASTMPDLNYQNAEVRKEMTDIARFWLERGAAGFRLDAARHLIETGAGPFGQSDTPETHAFWRDLRAAVDRAKPDALLVGEIWEKNAIVAPYLGTRDQPELHMAFDFAGAGGILNAIRSGDATAAKAAIRDRLKSYPSWGHAGTFLSNHDQPRVATQLEEAGPEALRLAAALLFTLPGTPWIYYGEEIGLKNGAVSGDAGERRPMQWEGGGPAAGFTMSERPWLAPTSTRSEDSVAGQARAPNSLLRLYRDLIRIRRASVALRRGSTRIIETEGSASLVLVREHEGERVLLAYNFAPTPSTIAIPGVEGEAFEDLLTGRIERLAPFVLSIEPRGFRVLVCISDQVASRERPDRRSQQRAGEK